MTSQEIIKLGYFEPKLLKTGEWAAIHRMTFTTGLFVGIGEDLYRTRFCYDSTASASMALGNWDGIGDPPGPWIKEKGRVERINPNR